MVLCEHKLYLSSWETLHNIIGAWLEPYFVIISIFTFLVVMHDKFGVLALSERWIQCICKKGIMLNKPRAVSFFEGSKSVKAGKIFLLNPVPPKIWIVIFPCKIKTFSYMSYGRIWCYSLIIFSFLSNKKCSDSHSLHAFNMAGPFLRFFHSFLCFLQSSQVTPLKCSLH